MNTQPLDISLYFHKMGHRISVKRADIHRTYRGEERIKTVWLATCTCHPRWAGDGKTRDQALAQLRAAALCDEVSR